MEELSNSILYGITQEVLESGSPTGEGEEEGREGIAAFAAINWQGEKGKKDRPIHLPPDPTLPPAAFGKGISMFESDG